MNEHELGRRIVQRLNGGLDQIKQGTLYRLQSARQAALDRYHDAAVSPALYPALAGAGFRVSHGRYLNARSMIALGLLLLSLVGVSYWQFVVQANDIAEIDASLLTGDLPINAYLDNNFEAWLKRSSQ